MDTSEFTQGRELDRLIAELRGWTDFRTEYNKFHLEDGYSDIDILVGLPPGGKQHFQVPLWSTDLNEAFALLGSIPQEKYREDEPQSEPRWADITIEFDGASLEWSVRIDYYYLTDNSYECFAGHGDSLAIAICVAWAEWFTTYG